MCKLCDDDAKYGHEHNSDIPDRTGYCAWCKHVPDGLISLAAENKDSKCYLCWFTKEKPNWEKA